MTKLKSPEELGIPFDKWRPMQEEGISLILSEQKRVTTICAPTGTGKEGLAVGSALMSGLPTCIVTDSRSLQDQYLKTYSKCGMVDIRGRANYQCDYRDDYTCEEGIIAGCPYRGTVACSSSQAEMRASTSSLVLTNYSKWCASKKYGQGMNHFQQVIFDEGHAAFGALAQAMQVILNHHEIEEELEVPFLDKDESHDIALWKMWALQTKEYAVAEANNAYNKVTSTSNPKPSWVKKLNHMRNLVRRLSILSTARAQDWVVDELEDGYQFDPIRPARYTENALLMRVPKIVMMSATIQPKTMYMVGIGCKDYTFHEFQSDFDVKDCPIYYIPTMRVDRYHTDLTQLWIRHDQIAARRRDRKSIVLPVSYARRDEIIEASRFGEHMLTSRRGEPPTQVIEDFKKSGAGTILVSPVVGTGHDFPGTDCEYIFLCKVPFLDSRSKIVRAREDNDPEYGPHIVAQTIAQNFGRDVRYKGDRGEGFIGDDHMSYFHPKWKYLFPRDFNRRYKRVEVVPQAPKAMGSN